MCNMSKLIKSCTLGSLLNVQYVKQFRPPILRSYCTFNRVLLRILKTVRLIESYTFRLQPSFETYTLKINYTIMYSKNLFLSSYQYMIGLPKRSVIWIFNLKIFSYVTTLIQIRSNVLTLRGSNHK